MLDEIRVATNKTWVLGIDFFKDRAFINQLHAKTNKKHIENWTASVLAECADYIISQK